MSDKFNQLVSQAKEKAVNGAKLTQCERIALELDHAQRSGRTVECFYFPMEMGILQYNARIKRLRDKYDAPIRNMVQWVDGQKHGEFWLEGGE